MPRGAIMATIVPLSTCCLMACQSALSRTAASSAAVEGFRQGLPAILPVFLVGDVDQHTLDGFGFFGTE